MVVLYKILKSTIYNLMLKLLACPDSTYLFRKKTTKSNIFTRYSLKELMMSSSHPSRDLSMRQLGSTLDRALTALASALTKPPSNPGPSEHSAFLKISYRLNFTCKNCICKFQHQHFSRCTALNFITRDLQHWLQWIKRMLRCHMHTYTTGNQNFPEGEHTHRKLQNTDRKMKKQYPFVCPVRE